MGKLRVIGAGLGRTGTHSLKLALNELLDVNCYHMVEVIQNREHAQMWLDEFEGRGTDFDKLFEDYEATVDWPSVTAWERLSELYPDALIILSTRENADVWYHSAIRTILPCLDDIGTGATETWQAMARQMLVLFAGDSDYTNEELYKASYNKHNEHVRATAPKDRLVDWQVTDGWAPLCKALSVPVPDKPFPISNTTKDFQDRVDKLAV